MTKRHDMLIKGRHVGGRILFPVVNPYSREVLGECPGASEEDVEEAVEGAKSAFSEFSGMPAFKRSEILAKTAALIRKNKEGFARLIVSESGKAYKYAIGEVKRAKETFTFASEEAKQIKGNTVPMDASSAGQNRFALCRPFPLGVIAAISPFNFPLNLVAHKVAPAIAAGNTVVLKPASSTPLTALKLGDIMMEAGLPAGALNIVTGSGKTVGDMLTSHPDISLISFTGSPPIGRYIKERCGMKKIVLELGSNSALIVEPDTDLDYIIPKCITGAFANSGQVCISLQRIFIHADIFDAFTEKIKDAASSVKVGDPMDPDTEYGPLIEEKETVRVLNWIRDAESQGAHIIIGGKREGNCIQPTILTQVNNNMDVCSKEVFGPVVSLLSYSSFEDAVKMTNDSEFGLHAGVFTKDIKKAFYAYEKLHVGGVIINDIPTFRTDNMPYGGVKMSGIGREGVKYAVSEMMETKLLVINLS